MTKKIIYFIILIFLSTNLSQAQTVTFNVTTKTYNGKYGPANCFALWITNASGVYVKTINRQSATYTEFLTYWKASSGTKLTDGMTGASLISHNYPYAYGTVSRIPFKWDCKDYNGNLVADGNYYVNVEFTEINGTGKFTRYLFTKGNRDSTFTYANATYFTSASLVYKSPVSAVENQAESQKYHLYYVKSTQTLNLRHEDDLSGIELMVYDVRGSLLMKRNITESVSGISMNGYTGSVCLVKIMKNSKIVLSQLLVF